MVPDQPASFEDWLNRPGPYFQPAVNADGYLYWTNNGGLPNPEPVRIVGRDGRGITLTGQCDSTAELPEDPDQGEAWAVGEEEPFECYAWFGEWFDMGLLFPAGQDGVSPTVTMTAITGGTRLTITDKDHPSGQSADIMNGSPGNPGQDGVSPAVSMEAITGGTRLTITDKDHPSGQSTDIMNGTPGQGVPAGGSAGQFYRKASGTNYDGEWHTLRAGDSSYDNSLTYASGTVGEELSSQRNTLNQLDGAKAAKVDLTNISQTSPTCTVTNGIAAGTYFYLDGVLTRSIEAISENASFTSSNCETVTAGGLNELNNNLNAKVNNSIPVYLNQTRLGELRSMFNSLNNGQAGFFGMSPTDKPNGYGVFLRIDSDVGFFIGATLAGESLIMITSNGGASFTAVSAFGS